MESGNGSEKRRKGGRVNDVGEFRIDYCYQWNISTLQKYMIESQLWSGVLVF